jgi:hypothetical protein
MSQGRAAPYHPGTTTLAIPLREPVCTFTTLCCVSSSEYGWHLGGSRSAASRPPLPAGTLEAAGAGWKPSWSRSCTPAGGSLPRDT